MNNSNEELKVSDVFNHPLDEDFNDPHSIISHLEYAATVCGSSNPERTNLVDDVAKEAIAYIKLQRAEIERLRGLLCLGCRGQGELGRVTQDGSYESMPCPDCAPPNIDWTINLIIRDMCELPDRSSPEDWPEAMILTPGEMHVILERHLKGVE